MLRLGFDGKTVTFSARSVYINGDLLATFAYQFFDNDGYEYYTTIFEMEKNND